MLLTPLIVMCTGTDKPNNALLNKYVIVEATSQWHVLGVQLLTNTVTYKLNVIREEYKDDDKKCCSEMLAQWLGDDFKATWNKLLDHLQQSGKDKVLTTVKRNVTIKGLP